MNSFKSYETIGRQYFHNLSDIFFTSLAIKNLLLISCYKIYAVSFYTLYIRFMAGMPYPKGINQDLLG